MFLLILIELLSVVLAFTPIWIGPQFRESTKISYENGIEIENICGRQKKSGEREFPWAVSILLNGQNRLGGSIISPYHILTVAHGFMSFEGGSETPCLLRSYRSIKEIRSTRIVAYGGRCIRGESDFFPNNPACRRPDVQYNEIRSVLIDGDFAIYGCHNGHDWAIIELEHKINFSSAVIPICLPAHVLHIDPILTVAGWGRSYIFNESGPLIHKVSMAIDKHCRRPWSDKLPHEAADYLCATSTNTTDYSTPRTCHGDSGSGMEQLDENGRSVLIAITSFGTRGCPANELTRFTRVNHYLRQICTFTGLCYSNRK